MPASPRTLPACGARVCGKRWISDLVSGSGVGPVGAHAGPGSHAGGTSYLYRGSAGGADLVLLCSAAGAPSSTRVRGGRAAATRADGTRGSQAMPEPSRPGPGPWAANGALLRGRAGEGRMSGSVGRPPSSALFPREARSAAQATQGHTCRPAVGSGVLGCLPDPFGPFTRVPLRACSLCVCARVCVRAGCCGVFSLSRSFFFFFPFPSLAPGFTSGCL